MDYINWAIEQLEKHNTISGTFAREQYNALRASQMPTEWRKEAPTVAGVYQAKYTSVSGSIIIQWVEVETQPWLAAYVFGVDKPLNLSDFSEWLGPFPMMDASA